jgi:hypothetical protein
MHTEVVEKNRIYSISNTFPENLAVSRIPETQQSERERKEIVKQRNKIWRHIDTMLMPSIYGKNTNKQPDLRSGVGKPRN